MCVSKYSIGTSSIKLMRIYIKHLSYDMYSTYDKTTYGRKECTEVGTVHIVFTYCSTCS